MDAGGYHAPSPRGYPNPSTPADVWGQAPTPVSGYGSSAPAGTPQTYSTPYSPPAATPAETPGMGAGIGSTPALVAGETPPVASQYLTPSAPPFLILACNVQRQRGEPSLSAHC